MLRRLTFGVFVFACALAGAACSSSTSVPSSGGQPGIGPNLATNTIYVSNTTQNAIELYTPSPGPSASPIYSIGGSNTGMSGPAYLAFDTSKNLYATTFTASTSTGELLIYKTYAIGNVLPYGSVVLASGVKPHGIAMLPGSNNGFVVATTQPGGFFTSAVIVYGPFTAPSAFETNLIAGASTQLSNPIGVAVDSNKNIYVANSGSGKITIYALPSPSPTPSSSPTPTASPSPTPTPVPSGQPTPTPSPTPTPASSDLTPTTTISCTCSMTQPTGLTLDSGGNLYVTDPVARALYVFNASQLAGGTLTLTPARSITSSSFTAPVDVKVDSSGTIYVVDAGAPPGTPSMLLIFASGASGNSTPSRAITLPAGSATGMALSP